jgi:hypothetical protein
MTSVVSFLLVALVIVNFALSSAFLMGPGVRSLFVPCEQVCLTSFARSSHSLRVARPSYSQLLAVKSVNTEYAVTELLEIVQPGLEGQYSAEQRNRIDELLAVLDAAGEGGSFLNDISINDYYRVEFTRDVARGKPVGGLFRYSALGRSLFKTEDAFQHVVVGNQAVNLLRFRFANICPGIIVLRGTFERCSASERREIERKYESPPPGLSPETIKVLFEPPRIFFGYFTSPSLPTSSPSLSPSLPPSLLSLPPPTSLLSLSLSLSSSLSSTLPYTLHSHRHFPCQKLSSCILFG